MEPLYNGPVPSPLIGARVVRNVFILEPFHFETIPFLKAFHVYLHYIRGRFVMLPLPVVQMPWQRVNRIKLIALFHTKTITCAKLFKWLAKLFGDVKYEF